MNTNENKIKKVAILDDDAKLFFSYEKLNLLIDHSYLDALSDIYSPARIELVSILNELSLPSDNMSIIIDAFNNENVIEKLPDYFKEGIYEPIKSRYDSLKVKIDVVINCLLNLGIINDNIHLFSSIDEIRASNEYFDLYIIDLFLEEGKWEDSINYLHSILPSDNHSKRQFILMSYDAEQLKNHFRSQHTIKKISSSQLKVIEKPTGDTAKETIRWYRLICQVILERQFIEAQRNMQEKWTTIIENASQSFIEKIWSLDNFAINKLRLTAEADDISLSDYLATSIYRSLIASVEANNTNYNSTTELANILKAHDEENNIAPSNEIYDSYKILTDFIADLTSYRSEGLKQINFIENNSESDYRKFISHLFYGSILKKHGDNKYYLHITQPCDYIHIGYSEAKNNNLFLVPGVEFSKFSTHFGGNKTYLSSFINTTTGTININWNLRQINTLSIEQLFNERSNYSVVGRLRDEEVQTISHQFGTSMSRIATNRRPWFDYIKCIHINITKNDESYLYSYFDKDKNIVPFKEISDISSIRENILTYDHHIDKIIGKRLNNYIIQTELNSIPDIIDSLSKKGIKIEIQDYPNNYILDKNNICNVHSYPITIIFWDDFKKLINKRNNLLSEQYPNITDHNFLVLIN